MSGVQDDLALIRDKTMRVRELLLHYADPPEGSHRAEMADVLGHIDDLSARVAAELERLRGENQGMDAMLEEAWDDRNELARLRAEHQKLRDGLRRISENAESWHGPEGLDTGHARALGVIARWARSLLAAEGQEPGDTA